MLSSLLSQLPQGVGQTIVETPMVLGTYQLLVRSVAAAALGGVLALVYRATHKGLSYSQSFTQTIVFVATVVAILFALVGAERAYFGTKDAQQIRVIRRMALDLALPTEVIPCPTVREPDGLAMSSRNARLSPEARAAAPVLYRALLAARDSYRDGERSAMELRSAMSDVLATEPRAVVEYVSVADDATLAELDVVGGSALLSLAVRFDDVRLIDNLAIGP